MLARDLMQAPDLGSLLELVAPALQELLLAENALVIVRLGGLEFSAAYGRDGLLREPREDGELCMCARRALEDQRPILLSDAPHDPDTRGVDALTAGVGSVLTVPFPSLQPVGVLGAFWSWAMSSQWLERRIPTTRQVAELLGAAIGNVELRLTLEREVSATHKETDQAVQRHEVELRRRDLVEDEIRRLSITDVLTGMLNRRGFFLRAEQSLKVVRRKRLPSALLFSDIDGLKMVNDRLGHDEGDRLIQDGASILRNCFRDSDVVARIGGDEFAAFTLDTADPDVILERIQREVEHFNRHSSRPYKVSLSTGIVPCEPSSDSDLSDYLALADGRMYAQKKGR
jgi:diguanylate cyclase (GGDEF)-like protein